MMSLLVEGRTVAWYLQVAGVLKPLLVERVVDFAKRFGSDLHVMWHRSAAFLLEFVFLGQFLQSFDGRFGSAGFDVGTAFAKEFRHLGALRAIQKTLVAGRILYDHFRLAIDGQHNGIPCLFHARSELCRFAFEVAQRMNVLGQVDHGSSLHI